MCLGIIASDGRKMDIFWFDPNRPIDQTYYMEVLQDVVKPWLDMQYGSRGVQYCWQQDGAPGRELYVGIMTVG